jgi:hypothetical protein
MGLTRAGKVAELLHSHRFVSASARSAYPPGMRALAFGWLLVACSPLVPTTPATTDPQPGPDASVNHPPDAASPDAGTSTTADGGQADAGASDAGGGQACNPVMTIPDPQFPLTPAPARLSSDSYRAAELNHRRLARAEASGSPLCPDEAWAYVSQTGTEGVVLTLFRAGQRVRTVFSPSAADVLHVELMAVPGGGDWLVGWVAEGRGVFVRRFTRDGLPVGPAAFVSSSSQAPVELVAAFGKALALVVSSTRGQAVLRLHEVDAQGTVSLFHEHRLEFASNVGGPSARFDGTELAVALPEGSPSAAFTLDGGTMVARPLSFGFPGAFDLHLMSAAGFTAGGGSGQTLVLASAGTFIGTRRYQVQLGCDTSRGRCSRNEVLPGSTWGGFPGSVWNHSGLAAISCGESIVVAFRSFDSIGDCQNYGYCRAGDLHLWKGGADQRFETRNLTPRAAPMTPPRFLGYPDQEVFSPIVWTRLQANTRWPAVDVAYLQQTIDGGVTLEVQRGVTTCEPGAL